MRPFVRLQQRPKGVHGDGESPLVERFPDPIRGASIYLRSSWLASVRSRMSHGFGKQVAGDLTNEDRGLASLLLVGSPPRCSWTTSVVFKSGLDRE